MIVDIHKFILKKFYNYEDGRIENTNYKALRNIYDFLDEYKIGINGKKTTISENIDFKRQTGGSIFSIKLTDNKKYKYHLDKITSLNKNNTEHELCFLNINEDQRCLCFTFHTKETGIDKLTIHDLLINDNDKYIECEEPKCSFKSGDILVKILIELVKTKEIFSHIKKIVLQDNSMKKCYGIGIQLKYLRTITDGIPYYAKFGFNPKQKTDLKIFEYNKKNFLNISNRMNNKVFDDLFLKIKENNKKQYDFYENFFRGYILNNTQIEYKTFIRKMIDMEKESKFSTKKKKITCELVANIIKPLFFLLGYKDYDSDLWVLRIVR